MLVKKHLSSRIMGELKTGESDLKVFNNLPSFFDMRDKIDECEPTTISSDQNFGDENIGPFVDIFQIIDPLSPQSLYRLSSVHDMNTSPDFSSKRGSLKIGPRCLFH
jgi:hypothetical protein